MSLKLRDTNNKFIIDFEETSKSITVTEFEPTTFNMKDGEYNFEPVETYEYSPSPLNGQPIHGSWYDDANQTTTANTTTAMKVYHGSGTGISIVDNSKLKVDYAGTYNIQFSAQLDQSSGAGHHIFIWFRKNGTDIPWSNGEVAIQGSSAEAIPSWNFLVDLVANDYIQVMYRVTNANVYIKAVAAGTMPGIPSVIITMWKL